MQSLGLKYQDAEVLDFPGIITLRVLLRGQDTGGSLAVFEDIVQPGIGPGRHIHRDQDETFLILEGLFDLEADGKRLTGLGPGDMAFVPRGTVHAFRNMGDGPGRLRYVFSPALVVEEMFRALHAASEAGALDPDAMARIAAEHGQDFVGPPLEP